MTIESPRKPLASTLLFALTLPPTAACVKGDGPPSLGDSGETGELQEEPLPAGNECGEHWYDNDGDPVPLEPDDQAGWDDALANHLTTIEFTGPPRVAAPRERPSREPSPGDQVGGRGGGPTPTASTYNVDGYGAAWSSGRKLMLTWCLGRIMPSPKTNPDVHQEHLELALETMEWATRAWERSGDVNFIHLREYDSPESYGSGDCQPGENSILFRVRTGPECTGSCGGRTSDAAIPYNEFVDPADIDGTREIVLGLQRFFHNENEARINALHELGHVMGFTHEHLQWKDEQDVDGCTALDSIPWRGVTPPDPDSIMAVDSCVGVNQNQPRLSPYDRLGSYYAYTWAHRRSRMMGAVSTIDDFAYDGLGSPGILWQTSRSPTLELWNSTGDVGAPIEFSIATLCVDGGAPPCEGSFDAEGRVRPTNAYLAGTAGDLDVLFHGPGPVLADLLAINDGLALDPWNLDLDGFAVPVVGSFTSGIVDQILLYRPGPEEDTLMAFEDDGVTFHPINYPGYAYPLAGRYRGFGGGGNDILWYEPQHNNATIWQWIAAPPFDFIANGPIATQNLGLQAGVEYLPLLGDFNADDKTDIFWYSAGGAKDIMWWSASNQDFVLFDVAVTQILDDYRPFVGDFDGDGTSDILWFAPYREAARAKSRIWYFSDDETFISRIVSTRHDYSPYVGDFDNDGCSDILWFEPNNPQLESALWRCVPGEREFVCDPPIATPAEAYPIGFGGAY